ncbi:FAD-binding oxidoreductase [Acidocella sp.]|uniref:NAD(P)/FAD-dependent oxidoreductase n=1 Tax=Acidocella sp. TaxID=50710 RepID=UPI0017A5D61A|nr:FAD-binding oxidoreductase [Acidocella sp.]NNM56523.1 FAD-binding oxidoreductase [Acidocella sp.]
MSQTFDVIVIGAGMAGASVAAGLGATHNVALVEAEAQAGYHTTGRSAAIWVRNYGPADVRVLTGLSRAFFLNPPADIGTDRLAVGREIIYLAPPEQTEALDGLIGQGLGIEEISLARVKAMVPALIEGYAVRAGIERDGFDMDVAALHQFYLRRARAAGGQLMLRSRAGRIERKHGAWEVETAAGVILRAPVVVNAAGAWADEVARIAGVAPLGLVACRRTAAIIDPAPYAVEHWPMVQSAVHDWYIRAEARTRLMVTPCDETPMHAHDVQPDEMDVAIGIDRMQKALDIPVRRVERAWAGLRTFSPDRSLAFGWETAVPGFFWCAGQGGYGIQTAPAAGALAAAMVKGEDPGPAAGIIAAIDPMRFRGRT